MAKFLINKVTKLELWKELFSPKKDGDLKNTVSDLKWNPKVGDNFWKEEGLEVVKILLFPQLWKEKKDRNNLMKSKILALSKNEDFKNLLKKKKVSNKYVTIFFGHLNNKNNRKLNISFVTKRKIGNAVKRNKIKRRLRNIINEAVKNISMKLSYSYLVIAKPTMLNNEYTNIKETLFQDLKKIR